MVQRVSADEGHLLGGSRRLKVKKNRTVDSSKTADRFYLKRDAKQKLTVLKCKIQFGT